METVLAAVDLSPRSRTVVGWAAAMAQRRKAPLVLLHVVEPPMVDVAQVPIGATEREAELLTKAELELARQADELRPRGIAVETKVRLGSASRVILQTALDAGARLIVLGTHGRKGAARLLLGSVAEQVTRASPCPVLIAPESTPALAREVRVRSILVAVDFSAASAEVVPTAYGLLRPDGGRVDLCTVHEMGAVGGMAEAPLEPPLRDEERAEVEAQLRAEIPAEAAAGRISTRVSVLEDRAAPEAILSAAEALDVDLVAVGSHGRSGFKRLILGSVAEYIARRSPRPVLIVRAPSSTPPAASQAPGGGFSGALF